MSFGPEKETARSREMNGVEGAPEIIPTPEPIISAESKVKTLSFLLKESGAVTWKNETQFANHADEYIKSHPLPEGAVKFIKRFRTSDAYNEEVLYMLAVAAEHPEAAGDILAQVRKNKPDVSDPQALLRELADALNSTQAYLRGSSLEQEFSTITERDISLRTERMSETKKRLATIIDFYRPDPATTSIRKVSFAATDPLYPSDSGRMVSYGDTAVILSHINNPDNTDHEFAHGIINPIVDKIEDSLTKEQWKKIFEKAKPSLRENYGDTPSLLCEELIRTYNDLIKHEKAPETKADFIKKISALTEEQFQAEIFKGGAVQRAFAELGIATLTDLKAKASEYHNRYEKNELRQQIYKMYQQYTAAKNENLSLSFETFLLQNYSSLIDTDSGDENNPESMPRKPATLEEASEILANLDKELTELEQGDADRLGFIRKLLDILRRDLDKTSASFEFREQVSPENRNFEIEVVPDKKDFKLVLKRNDGNSVDLSIYLPPKHRFSEGRKYLYSRVTKEVAFEKNDVGNRGFLLSLFHELGHSHQPDELIGVSNKWQSAWAKVKSLYGVLKDLYQVMRHDQELARDAGGKEVILTSLEVREIIRVQLGENPERERGAWAYALDNLRGLQDEGYEVFSGFKNVTEIKVYIDRCLLSYEVSAKLVDAIEDMLGLLKKQPPTHRYVKSLNKKSGFSSQ